MLIIKASSIQFNLLRLYQNPALILINGYCHFNKWWTSMQLNDWNFYRSSLIFQFVHYVWWNWLMRIIVHSTAAAESYHMHRILCIWVCFCICIFARNLTTIHNVRAALAAHLLHGARSNAKLSAKFNTATGSLRDKWCCKSMQFMPLYIYIMILCIH